MLLHSLNMTCCREKWVMLRYCKTLLKTHLHLILCMYKCLLVCNPAEGFRAAAGFSTISSRVPMDSSLLTQASTCPRLKTLSKSFDCLIKQDASSHQYQKCSVERLNTDIVGVPLKCHQFNTFTSVF